ncbi:pirin family protein [Polaribacter sp.]|uniref:pirin family protein n=1 Tax=Polaribacter sp. TaxID=1920175 RepID=UPI0025EDE750|nr:pirin family protein [Polaribacter sp.]
MKKTVHKSETRGFANHGWLKSHHTFSFASYQNPERMNFGMLRVLNDDIVQPKMGFGTHPHKNMEIISIPITGALSHKDSMENKRSIEVNEVQVMSAGTGVTHSEFNDSKTEETNFLQIWIIPNKQEVPPYYDQHFFNSNACKNKFQTLVSPRSKTVKGSLPVYQDAYIYKIDLDNNFSIPYTLNNAAYFFLIEGEVSIADEKLNARDALGIEYIKEVTISAHQKSKLLVIDVPMI